MVLQNGNAKKHNWHTGKRDFTMGYVTWSYDTLNHFCKDVFKTFGFNEEESNEIKDYFNLNANLKVNDSIYDSGEYECLFTCPPYGNKENWHQEIEVLSADEWIDVCLKNYKCKAYLFVVDKTEKYKNFVVEEFKNKSYLNENSEQVVFIKK